MLKTLDLSLIEKDYEMAKNMTPEDARKLYGHIAAGAESGWDFSSRWFIGGNTMDFIATNDIIPVDLNAILYQMEMNLYKFFKYLNNEDRANFYLQKSEQRKNAIMKVLWNEEQNLWFDYDMKNGAQRTTLYPSNFFPIWTNSYDSQVITNEVKDQITRNLNQLIRNGGVVTSLVNSSQQWDFPNAWAPVQDIIVSGLENLNTELSRRTAETLAVSWITNNYMGWTHNNTMFEKYNAVFPGQRGAGGEYEPQDGFGWTNGVLLSLITKYRNVL